MTTSAFSVTASALADDAVALARRWTAQTDGGASRSEAAASTRLAQLVADPVGLDLAVAFVDKVARPEDLHVAARELAALPAKDAAAFLGPIDRALLAVGQKVARLAPAVTVPAARLRLRQLVGHLVLDATDAALTTHLARARAEGYRLNINLLGEAVLGEAEAASRVARTIALVERPDVDYVSIKASSLVSQISTWDAPGTVARVLERLRPLYRAAQAGGAFVNLDMEEYRDLDVTIEVFTALLSEPEFHGYHAGIVLQAYLPDAPAAFERLVAFASARVAASGAPIKVRLVKGANLAMERVEAQLHDWPQAPHLTKADADATYVRVMDRALTPEVTAAVRLGVAGHNLYHLALAHLLATGRGVADALDVEMLQGMAPAQARAVQQTVGSVLLYTPVVAPKDFDVAVSYLVRRLEENAQPENYLHAATAGGPAALGDQEQRFRTSVAQADTAPDTPYRTGEPLVLGPDEPFSNARDSDPAVGWVRDRARSAVSTLQDLTPSAPCLTTDGAVDDVVATARGLAAGWGTLEPGVRADVLDDVANRIEAARWDLLAVMAHEAGKTAAEADPEITEAIDFARYYARAARALAEPASAVGEAIGFDPVGVTLVTPPWNFPVAIAVGGVLAALAAGSAVVMKPSPLAQRCGEAVASHVRDALVAAGFEADLVQAVQVPENEVGRHLVAHDGVDQVILTGSIETGRLFAGWRAGRVGGPRVFAETSGKNALIVTPSADLDLAVADVVRSAFGHAGQKCSAASLVILVGSVGTSRRFLGQLRDAVTSLRVGPGSDLGAGMGPVIEPPRGDLLRALTTLDDGEGWLVRPAALSVPDGAPEAERLAGRLWSPGVRDGVRPGSWFHLTECFGPVLGIMRAESLEQAIRWQNAVSFGLTGGIHSLDDAEVSQWLDRVEVGNAYVNRVITGAIVQRQPFGGWKDSAMGPGAKAGGPHYVAQLGRWRPVTSPEGASEGAFADLDRIAEVDRALLAGPFADVDASGLEVEENTLRHLPVPELTVRAVAGADAAEVARVLGAADVAGVVRVSLSAAESVLAGLGHSVRVEDDAAFAARVAAGQVLGRVRLVTPAGEPFVDLELYGAAASAGVAVLDGPVLASGERELLTVLREQAVSRTRHRFGHVHG